MKKLDFWRADWFLGLAVALLLLAFSGTDLVLSLERKAYDMGVQATAREPMRDVHLIVIDEQSIGKIGRRLWSREILARMTDLLAGAKPKVIGSAVLLSEPQVDAGYPYIVKLIDLATRAAPAGDMGQFVALLRRRRHRHQRRPPRRPVRKGTRWST